MNYSLIRLRFDGLAHFGTSDSALSLFTSEDHFYADTLFSALCHTALSLHGIDGLQSLLQQAADGSLLLSDSMPWHRTAHGVITTCPSLAGLFLVSRRNRTCRRAAAKQ